MTHRPLGRTGFKVSPLCLGTMTWGVQNSETEGHAQMDYALERGINFFDTAEIYAIPPSADTYGRTESIIGTWFAARGTRDRVILASKVAGPGLAWVRGGTARIDRRNIVEAVEDSLKRLQTDYIDLYQLHWPNRDNYHFDSYWDELGAPGDSGAVLDNFVEVLETLGGLIRAGKIRAAGLSNETAWGTLQYLRLAEEKGLPRMASIQNEYSLLNRKFEPELAEIVVREDIGLLAWSPLATGMMSGKYLGGKRPKGARWSLGGGRRAPYRDSQPANDAVRAYIKVARKHKLDVCQMALAFVTGRPFVTSTIIGATTMEQLRSNIDSLSLTLDRAVLDDIAAVRRLYPVVF